MPKNSLLLLYLLKSVFIFGRTDLSLYRSKNLFMHTIQIVEALNIKELFFGFP